MPSMGDIISDLWVKAHQTGPVTIQANYNFDDMDIANEIVAQAKAGHKQVLVGDYSNWFPERLSQTNHGGKHQEQTEAMKLILANLGPNLELHILKGLGSIGINHNKFTIFYGPNGEKLLQSGSFNYTKTSQLYHWENVVFTDDAERIAYFEKYFQWLTRRARPYSPDLMPEDPKFDANDPIPTPPASNQIVFHGVPFPKASFSPNGGTEGWLVKMEQLVQRTLDILMFSPFPTQSMSQAALGLIGKGKPVRMIADEGQLANATPMLALVEGGLQLKAIHGPDVEVEHKPFNEHSKQHEKVMIADGRTQPGQQPDGIVKMADSLNISNNALMHNFENTQFWVGWFVEFMQAHFDTLWALAHPVEQKTIDHWREKLAAQAAGKDQPTHWEGHDPKAPPTGK
jgi:hypothetical protein